MDTFSPIVITSKAATDHLGKIKSEHSDMMQGIQNQSVRVANYNAEQDMIRQANEQQNKIEQKDNQKMVMDAETKRIEAENKAKELDIKQQALSL